MLIKEVLNKNFEILDEIKKEIVNSENKIKIAMFESYYSEYEELINQLFIKNKDFLKEEKDTYAFFSSYIYNNIKSREYKRISSYLKASNKMTGINKIGFNTNLTLERKNVLKNVLKNCFKKGYCFYQFEIIDKNIFLQQFEILYKLYKAYVPNGEGKNLFRYFSSGYYLQFFKKFLNSEHNETILESKTLNEPANIKKIENISYEQINQATKKLLIIAKNHKNVQNKMERLLKNLDKQEQNLFELKKKVKEFIAA